MHIESDGNQYNTYINSIYAHKLEMQTNRQLTPRPTLQNTNVQPQQLLAIHPLMTILCTLEKMLVGKIERRIRDNIDRRTATTQNKER